MNGTDLHPPRLIVRTRRVEGAPVASVRVWIRGGARSEAIPGQALLTGRLLADGTHRRDWRRIAEEAEDRGMILATFGSFEAHGVAVEALAADLDDALAWAAELVFEPSFPEDRCSWLARQAAAELESLADQPEVRAAWAFLDQLYRPHPRSRPLHGSAESLAQLTPADCAAFHRDALAGGAVVSVAGAVDEDAVRRRTEELFASLEGTARARTEPPAPTGLRTESLEVEVGTLDQVHLYLGHLSVPLDHPDVPALDVLGIALGAGAGLQGRIPQRIRERDGLAYSVHVATVAGAGLDPGRLVVYLGTSSRSAARAERGVRDELERLLAEGVREEEVEDARAYLLGREPFRRETAQQWAELMAEAAFYGIPVDRPEWVVERIAAVDRAGVEAAARRWIRPAELRVTAGVPERRRAVSGAGRSRG